MDDRRIRFALTLAATRNFHRAAQIEHIAQSAFSAHIRRLEAEVGARLFDRDSHAVSVTAAGERFLREAAMLSDRMGDLIEEVRQIHRGERGRLAVGIFAEGLAECMPAVVRAFRAASPHVELRFVELRIDQQHTALDEGHVDVAIVRPPLEHPGVEVELLYSEPRVAVVPLGHALAEAPTVSIADIGDDPVVSADPARWGAFYAADHLRGAAGRPVATVRTVAEALSAVAFVGATDTAPASAARYFPHAGVRYIPLRDADTTPVAVAHRAGDTRAVVTSFRMTARHVCRSRLDLVPGATPA